MIKNVYLDKKENRLNEHFVFLADTFLFFLFFFFFFTIEGKSSAIDFALEPKKKNL